MSGYSKKKLGFLSTLFAREHNIIGSIQVSERIKFFGGYFSEILLQDSHIFKSSINVSIVPDL